MNILVINAGSSSLKFQLYGSEGDEVLARGRYLHIGDTVANVKSCRVIDLPRGEYPAAGLIRDHRSAMENMLGLLKESRLIEGPRDIAAVGHRIVHGGERFDRATLITEEVLRSIEDISALAPLHNPVGLSCIRIAGAYLPETPQYAVFDTAFHKSIPETAYLYGLPLRLYREHGIRKYGFHGINHKYCAKRVAEILGRDIAGLRIITCHLGNGQSICAVDKGRSVDTSMGFTPLEGLPMGTRSGSFDPEIIFFLMGKGLEPKAIKTMINKHSGLLGLSGISSDYQVIEGMARSGHPDARRTCEILANRIVSLIGAYTAQMGGVDAVAFTGGIGENSAALRKRVLGHFGYLGLRIGKGLNEANGPVISSPGSAVHVLVIPANEELQIARETAEEFSKGRASAGYRRS